ncbi:MAG: hypothetical protein E7287_02730 [Lachnospiraceae bacterium]|nr:hypothetical protein [Lachnospiraceae bacterium]
MNIKQKYQKLNGIAVVLAIVLGLIVGFSCNQSERLLMWIFLFMGIFTYVLDAHKTKAIDRELGIYKIKDNYWMDRNGYWHEGGSEIYALKLENYFANGGQAFGYTFGPSMRLIFIIIFVLTISYAVGLPILESSKDRMASIVILSLIWLYILFRKVIRG